MRIAVHDFGGYAFPHELSEELARRGHTVAHIYCTSHNTTPRGVASANTSPSSLVTTGLSLRDPLNKYNFIKRWQQEREYGRLAVEALKSFRPDVVLSANTPLDAQQHIQQVCQRFGFRFVFWLQDLIGVAANNILRKKIPVAGALIGKHYLNLEKKLLQKSECIVAITDDFSPLLCRYGVPQNRIRVIPNWAPLEQTPVLEKNNPWSKKNGLEQAFCYLYAGTLGMKHNPDMLLQLALAHRAEPDTRVVVLSQGMGADWLAEQKQKHGLPNLLLLPYQPKHELPSVLASANVLVALLDDDAGMFSVPSKVLTYLCAERPLLLSVPEENQAARLIVEHEAGEVTPPNAPDAFVAAALRLKNDAKLRNRYAHNARSYAERTFAMTHIGDQFERILLD